MAALNDALAIAIGCVPENCHQEIKRAIGRAMFSIMDETIDSAIRAFPELKPSQETWCAVANARAGARARQMSNSPFKTDGSADV